MVPGAMRPRQAAPPSRSWAIRSATFPCAHMELAGPLRFHTRGLVFRLVSCDLMAHTPLRETAQAWCRAPSRDRTSRAASDQEHAMRFGTFVFSMSSDPAQDHQVIDQTLREVELAETIGMDAVWLTEHHFDGAVAYADPVVFAAAVAMRTHRIRIGFAVVELALHHPVRLAVQTALVDHLSRGRLIVGTGRGSAYNAYEYVGFGTTLAEGRERLPEAEALLIKAWTTDDVRHDGHYWQATFPRLR